MHRKILLVDDEIKYRRFLKEILKSQGFSVNAAARAEDAVLAIEQCQPDLVISDVAMPGLSGIEMMRTLKSERRTARIPVILMSGSRMGEEYQADGIEMGADDYLIKPFTPRLVLSKIKGVLRRCSITDELPEILKNYGLRLNIQDRTAQDSRGRLKLTRKEFDLLTTFLRKRGKVLVYEFILESIWGYDLSLYNDPHTIETHVSSLRRKLGTKFAQMIVNVPGIGYRFEGK